MTIPPLLIWLTVYAAGYALSFTMLRIEQVADNETYTRGDKALALAMSLGSLVTVMIMLIGAWIRAVGLKGYWERPVVEPKPKENVTLIDINDKLDNLTRQRK